MLAGERAGGPNSDDWRESLTLCLLCGTGNTVTVKSRKMKEATHRQGGWGMGGRGKDDKRKQNTLTNIPVDLRQQSRIHRRRPRRHRRRRCAPPAPRRRPRQQLRRRRRRENIVDALTQTVPRLGVELAPVGEDKVLQAGDA